MPAGTTWGPFNELARSAKVASSWSVPVLGPGGLLGVITVFRATAGPPRRDDLDLAIAVRRVRGQRGGPGPAARRGHRAEPGAGDDPGDAADPGRAGAGGRGAGRGAAGAAPWAGGRRGRAAGPATGRGGGVPRRGQPRGGGGPRRGGGGRRVLRRPCGTPPRPRWPRPVTTARRCAAPARRADRGGAAGRSARRAGRGRTCWRSRSRRRAAGPRWSPGGWRRAAGGRDRAAGGRRALAAAGAGTGGGLVGPPGDRWRCAGPGNCSAASCPGSATSCAPR